METNVDSLGSAAKMLPVGPHLTTACKQMHSLQLIETVAHVKSTMHHIFCTCTTHKVLLILQAKLHYSKFGVTKIKNIVKDAKINIKYL